MSDWSKADGPILDIEHVSVDFFVRKSFFSTRPIHAVTDVSLAVAKGETVALVGESGSGKTTLGRATLHLVPIAGGRIIFEGRNVGDLAGKELMSFRQRAQIIFQDPFSSLSPYMRVGQLVEEPLVIHGPKSRSEREQLVITALEQVKLSPAAELMEKYPHTLSGGQRQRVSIARAMILRPDYLVADEPVSMIDASSRAEILNLLSELQDQNQLTFLYITHDLASARHFADRIAVMYAGRIVELAPAAQLVEDARHPYSKALLAAVPAPDPANRLRARPVVGGEPPDAGALPTGCAFHPRCPVAIKGTCDVVVPPLIELADGHEVACHLYPATAAAASSAGDPATVSSWGAPEAGASDGGAASSSASASAAAAAAARSASMTSSAASNPGSSDAGKASQSPSTTTSGVTP
ncbi:MAG: ABC transporter ATP-binding protein [Chloroflexota bacterium]